MQLYQTRNSSTRVFQWISQNFKEQLSYKTLVNGYLYTNLVNSQKNLPLENLQYLWTLISRPNSFTQSFPWIKLVKRHKIPATLSFLCCADWSYLKPLLTLKHSYFRSFISFCYKKKEIGDNILQTQLIQHILLFFYES